MSHQCIFVLAISLATLGLPDHLANARTDPATDEKRPELEVILTRWADAMSVEQSRQVFFRRYEYDHTFYSQVRATGSFALSPDGQARFLLSPAVIPQSGRSAVTRNGVQYSVTTVTPLECYWDKSTFYHLNPADSTFFQTSRGIEHAWFDLFRSLRDPQQTVPLMLGMTAEQLQHDIEWEVDSTWKRRDTEIRLIGMSKLPIRDVSRVEPEDIENDRDLSRMGVTRVEVLLDRRTFETYALRLTNSMMNKETVYVIERVIDVKEDLWTPDLRDYQILK